MNIGILSFAFNNKKKDGDWETLNSGRMAFTNWKHGWLLDVTLKQAVIEGQEQMPTTASSLWELHREYIFLEMSLSFYLIGSKTDNPWGEKKEVWSAN